MAMILKLQLHDAIYRLRFYSKSLIHILSLSNSHNNVASIQRIGAINYTVYFLCLFLTFSSPSFPLVVFIIQLKAFHFSAIFSSWSNHYDEVKQ